MRRFEAEDSQRFWEITWNDHSFFTRHGKLGTDGRAMPPHEFNSPEAMQREMERRIDGTLAKGYREVTDTAPREAHDAELERALHEHPDDEALWSRLLALHEAHGDARVELARASDDDAQRAVLKKHPLLPASITAQLRKKPKADKAPAGYTSIQWRHGYVHTARLARNSERPPVTVREMTEGLLSHASGRFMHELVIGALGVFDEYDYREVVSALTRVGSPSLRRLVLAEFTTEHCALNWSALGAVAGLGPAFPRLQELVLRAGSIDLSGLHAPLLQSLSITTINAAGLEALAATPWPELLHLQLHAADQALPTDSLLRALRQAPSLRSLALVHTHDTGPLLAALAESEILGELDRLSIEEGTLVDDDVMELLSELPADLEISLPGHALTPRVIERAREEGLTLEAPRQRVLHHDQTLVTEAMVRSFAPDSRSMAAAKKITAPEHWPRKGRTGDLLWGNCQGGELYEVFVDASNQDAGCTCPSPKYPCKHTIALLMIAASGEELPAEEVPEGLVERCGSMGGPRV